MYRPSHVWVCFEQDALTFLEYLSFLSALYHWTFSWAEQPGQCSQHRIPSKFIVFSQPYSLRCGTHLNSNWFRMGNTFKLAFYLRWSKSKLNSQSAVSCDVKGSEIREKMKYLHPGVLQSAVINCLIGSFGMRSGPQAKKQYKGRLIFNNISCLHLCTRMFLWSDREHQVIWAERFHPSTYIFWSSHQLQSPGGALPMDSKPQTLLAVFSNLA